MNKIKNPKESYCNFLKHEEREKAFKIFEGFEDGSLRLAYTGMMKWQKLAYSVTHDIKKIDEMRETLSKQFVEIYKHKMRTNVNIPQRKSIER